MTWNYRICKSKKDGYTVREAYYNNGKIWGLSEASSPYGETFDEIKEDLQYMYGAICDEVVDLDTIEFADPPWVPSDLADTISLEELKEDIGVDDEGDTGL